ncbi:unnamed protein product [Phytophthora fragariaefolia]|uniref:Unnamed protein product n=1 Tax=Phytophthora fragariaefolia TaxID=1490495 RepID=A0A9W6TZ87_9STRA|nr:unnamed protein product [Phytophthora fragariaefolia]
MYNANVSCAILRSFVKNTCARDVEDVCKQKNIQLGIELDALSKIIQASEARGGAASLGTGRSAVSAKSGAGSRPPSGASRPVTPTMQAVSSASTAPSEDDITGILAKKAATEAQLEVVAEASKLAKGTVIVDLADDHGTRLKLDETGEARANTILKSRAQYTAVAVSKSHFAPRFPSQYLRKNTSPGWHVFLQLQMTRDHLTWCHWSSNCSTPHRRALHLAQAAGQQNLQEPQHQRED